MKVDHNYLKHRKYSYFELLTFAMLANSNPGVDADQILIDMMRLELLEHSTDINEKLCAMMLNVTSKYHGITIPELTGTSRKSEFVRARQMFCYWAVKSMHQHTVSKYSGLKRDTIQAAKTKCAILMETEPDYADECAEIGQQIDVLRLGIQFDNVRKHLPNLTPSSDAAINNQKQIVDEN